MTNELPLLKPIEIRVLGSLIEKSKTTPDYYPMTLNALTAACNQKTSRHPVTDYDETSIQQALNALKAQSLVATAVGAGNRSLKYKHNFNTVFEMEPEELAILCLLMLRGPQTPGELNTNSARLVEFKSLEQVYSTLAKLTQGERPFVKELAKQAGQKETRYVHLLGDLNQQGVQQEPASVQNMSPDTEARLLALEIEVAKLRQIITQLGLDT